jgi:Protein of unknown function (DUF1524)
LGRERMVALFAHIRMIYERDKPRLALEAGFPKFVPPFTEDADAFVSNVLEPLADAWLLLTDTARVQKHFGGQAAKAVRSLDRIDNKDWVPPALLRVWKWGHDESSAIAGFLIALERLAYFLFVTRAGVNDRIGRFSAVMDEFEPRKGKETPTDGLSLSDPEQQQFVRVISGPLYQASRVCKPVMQRLDEALSSGGASYDELVSIEHVLPQTVDAGSEWALLFPDEQERSDWTHRLANLVFLTHRINTRASNWDFERLNAIDVEEEQNETIPEKAPWEFTDSKIIAAKREKMMQALGRKEGVTLNKKGALCWTNDKVFRAVCTVSKRYSTQRPYWYGYSAEWRKFLSEGQRSFLVFGCVDRDTAYSVPVAELEKIIDDLHRIPDKRWHVVLDENETGGLDLVRRSGLRLQLDKYELKLVK